MSIAQAARKEKFGTVSPQHELSARSSPRIPKASITIVAAMCYGRNMTGQGAEPRRWLLVSITTGADASLRVHVWRQLRKLGAIYLQSSVCLLPETGTVPQAVQRLAARVRDSGGKARVLHTVFTEQAEQDGVIAEQRADRDV